MTLMCIERSQSPTHNGSFLQGRKSPVKNSSNNNNNNNVHQQNANNNNNNNNHHHHNRRNSVSPPLPKSQQQQPLDSCTKSHESSRKLERSCSEPADRRVVPSNSSRYKTELCRPFEENGTCKYGDKCQFAHGQKELRSMARHPKYKTELCRTFHSTGLCPYGPRCHFIHNSEQSKKSLLTNLTARPSLGSAGDVSPPGSLAGTPTVSKNFTFDLNLVGGPNLNNPNFNFSPLPEYLPEHPQQHPFQYAGGEDSSDSSEAWYPFCTGRGVPSPLDVSSFVPLFQDDFFTRMPSISRIQTH